MTNDERMSKPEGRKAAAAEAAFWAVDEGSSVVKEESPTARVFDLEERTAKFGEAVIDFAKTIPLGPLTNRLVDQLVGCGTSVGANYCEADDAVSKKEFLLKINTCRKEVRDTKFFIRMVVRALPQLPPPPAYSGRKPKNST